MKSIKDMNTYRNYVEFKEKAGCPSDYRVAQETGVPQFRLTRWKKGYCPRYPDLRKIAEYLGVTVDDFYRDETI